MSMADIRKRYGVPAKRGMRVIHTYKIPHRKGTITGSRGSRLLIRLDGDAMSAYYHPTWELTYLEKGVEA